MQTLPRMSLFLALSVFVGCSPLAGPPTAESDSRPLAVHPVFHTPVSSTSRARPALQVEILDASKYWLFTAKFYLAVQSSRFPSDTWVVLPLNVGDFQGCETRFVQLPFEVQDGDTLLFNLLEDVRLSSDQQSLLLQGCRATGFCVICAGKAYCPEATQIVGPVLQVGAEILGQAVLQELEINGFSNLGTAEFHVPASLPAQAGEANRLTLLNNRNYARVVVKLFGPTQPLVFEHLSSR